MKGRGATLAILATVVVVTVLWSRGRDPSDLPSPSVDDASPPALAQPPAPPSPAAAPVAAPDRPTRQADPAVEGATEAKPALEPWRDPALPADRRADALLDFAERALDEQRLIDAVDALKAAVDLDPSARTHGALGEVLFKAGVAEGAVYQLESARDHDPNNPDRWIALANAYYLNIEPGKAWEASRRARELDPETVLIRDERGMFTRSGASTKP